MNTTLIVVRHGNTFNSGDVILRVGGKTDIPLTEKGIAQGSAVGRALAAAKFAPAQIFTAPLLRTRRSAEEIAASFPGTPISVENFLTELDYGIDDGAPEADVVLRLGIIDRRDDINVSTTIDELREAGKAVLKRWDNEAVLPVAWFHLQPAASKLGISWKEFGSRIVREFTGKTVVAVTSNGIARFSKSLLPPDAILPDNLKLATGAYGIYTHDGNSWQCTGWNIRPEL